MRQSQKPKDATPIKEEAYEEEFSDGEDQFKRQQEKVQANGIRRKTTIGEEFDRDSDSREIEDEMLQVESEFSKHSKSGSFEKNQMLF